MWGKINISRWKETWHFQILTLSGWLPKTKTYAWRYLLELWLWNPGQKFHFTIKMLLAPPSSMALSSPAESSLQLEHQKHHTVCVLGPTEVRAAFRCVKSPKLARSHPFSWTSKILGTHTAFTFFCPKVRFVWEFHFICKSQLSILGFQMKVDPLFVGNCTLSEKSAYIHARNQQKEVISSQQRKILDIRAH